VRGVAAGEQRLAVLAFVVVGQAETFDQPAGEQRADRAAGQHPGDGGRRGEPAARRGGAGQVVDRGAPRGGRGGFCMAASTFLWVSDGEPSSFSNAATCSTLATTGWLSATTAGVTCSYVAP
jgi:hypothetical protein